MVSIYFHAQTIALKMTDFLTTPIKKEEGCHGEPVEPRVRKGLLHHISE